MSGDPPSEPPEDGEGDERRKREEAPDRSADETADSDQPEAGAPDPETPADDHGPDTKPDDEDTDADVGTEAADRGSDDVAGETEEEADGDAGEGTDGDEPAEEGGVSGADERGDDGGDDVEEGGDADDETDGDGEEDDTSEGEDEEGEVDEDGEKGEEPEGDGEVEPEPAMEVEDEDRVEDEEPESEDEDEEEDEELDGEDEEEDEEPDGEEEEGPAADTSVEMHDDTTPIERKTGPASDTEQPLADHIEEMIKRLAVVVIVAGGVSLLAFPFGEDFIIFLWYSVLPSDISQPHVYHPLELVMTQLKAASLLGLVLALPVFVYETYAFMRPGLYPHERRYYLAAVPTSLVLASVGLLFGYFLVLPAVMTYFLYYSRDVVDIAFALGQTFDLMLILLGYLAVVFQIPLFIMLAIMMGLTTRTWLEDRRLIFWGAFLGISFLFSPDPTGMAPIIVAATMVGLFEGTLMLLRWTGR